MIEPLHGLGLPILFLDPVRSEVLERCHAILEAIARTAPRTVGGVVVVTSTLRPYSPGERPSYHHAGYAIDWRTVPDRRDEFGNPIWPVEDLGSIVAPSRVAACGIAQGWAQRVAARLGDTYDVIGPPDTRHLDHNHAEHDQRKAARVYLATGG